MTILSTLQFFCLTLKSWFEIKTCNEQSLYFLVIDPMFISAKLDFTFYFCQEWFVMLLEDLKNHILAIDTENPSIRLIHIAVG